MPRKRHTPEQIIRKLREATLRAVRNPGTATLARDLKSSES